mmetsp:Transcript_4238/g.6329  ORF Transcript_4238/g.6329 Transcript_4238/m.6329 type:complete len:416 (-) Transcript_4238:272-1519(-)
MAEFVTKAEKQTDFNPWTTYGPINAQIFSSPNKYVQKDGLIKEFGAFVRPLHRGKENVFGGVIISERGRREHGQDIENALMAVGAKTKFIIFGKVVKECCAPEVASMCQELEEAKGTDTLGYVIGVGGGKPLDAARLVAYKMDVPFICMPSLASTDAPCAALSAFYTPEGEFSHPEFVPTNPYLVAVDLGIVANSPSRYLVSGMGDAMGTFYEARAVYNNDAAQNMVGGRPTLASVALGQTCRDNLLKYGVAARTAAENNEVNKAVEAVTEANTLLSGLGFESGGLAAAHGVTCSLSVIPAIMEKSIHGEQVAVGTMVQLMMEEDMEEATLIGNFFLDVGLPVTFDGVGFDVDNDTEGGLEKIVEAALVAPSLVQNMGMNTTAEQLKEYCLRANAFGKNLKAIRAEQSKKMKTEG